jgi:hypothetical protein
MRDVRKGFVRENLQLFEKVCIFEISLHGAFAISKRDGLEKT